MSFRRGRTASTPCSKKAPILLVPGRTRPITGKAEIATVLTGYRDGRRFVFGKIVEDMNKGFTPHELVEYMKLPRHLAEKDDRARRIGVRINVMGVSGQLPRDRLLGEVDTFSLMATISGSTHALSSDSERRSTGEI